MKVLIATDSFKDCLSAKSVGESIKRGLLQSSDKFDIKIVPMADGGEGTVEALVDATMGIIKNCSVKDALYRDTKAFYGILGDKKTAVIEMAAASGIESLKLDERNPWITSTFGTGELILDALNNNCRRIIIGIGGSATNDGGVGMAMALGAKFLDRDQNSIPLGAGGLSHLNRIDLSTIDARIKSTEIIVACDVSNPLTGKEGASYVYGLQKGASEEMLVKLDSNLGLLANRIKLDLGKDIEAINGAGAAGGLGAGLMAFCGGKLQKGFTIVAQETNLKKHCQWADIVITGEGKIDLQTKYGKTPLGVAYLAKSHEKPIIAIAGTLGDDYVKLYECGFSSIFSIIERPMSLQEALNEAPELLENCARSIANMLLLIKKKPQIE